MKEESTTKKLKLSQIHVTDWLDTNRTLLSKRYFRQLRFPSISSCTQHNGKYLKNLATVEPDLSQVCLIDNSPISYAINQDNGIPMAGWMNDPQDGALLDLLSFLDGLRFSNDVESILSVRII
ncbi:CTD nuclear envelope phosphatase 1-like protein [Cladochytrium replicatum]|nr:CTD nuclear envelope phosphatase 1-like protein [Cladochytrium replicatum]